MNEAQPSSAAPAAFLAWLAAAFLAAAALGTTRGTAVGMGAWDAFDTSGVPAVAFCRRFLDTTMSEASHVLRERPDRYERDQITSVLIKGKYKGGVAFSSNLELDQARCNLV